MSYALTTIWYERSRFLPAILAVAFSALLIALLTGLVLGLLSMMSTPVDRSSAQIWVGRPGVRSVDLGGPIPDYWMSRLAEQPEVDRVEPCLIGFALWARGDRISPEAITVVGTRLEPDSIGAVEPLKQRPDLLAELAEVGAVVVDESDVKRLGIRGVAGERAEVFGYRVRVVGTVQGLKGLGGPFVFCSLRTARILLKATGPQSNQVTYWLGSCHNPADAPAVVARLRGSSHPRLAAFTSEEFSTRSRLHWLTTTKAGVAMGFTALLGLVVGAVVVSQTLYAATVASQREYATLRAMGIPRWRLKASVLAQSFWVGLGGVLIAAPITYGLALVATRLGTAVSLTYWIVGGAVALTLAMAVLSGLAALRSFGRVDPAHNIR
jgi:putative ABC transport system permease protein